jgi:uncharacterized protein YjbI with pentapeptide repeats/energy-coupling factor transporter ATP-binding protein EcfA2
MIEPARAPVRPRVFSSDGTLLLEEEVGRFLAENASDAIAVVGDIGSGKTTALRHLAAVIPSATKVTFLDQPSVREITESTRLLVYSTTAVHHNSHLAIYALVGWGKDDLIEYLLALHKDRCGSVMSRITSQDFDLLEGIPDLWQIALEELAADSSQPDARGALLRYVEKVLADVGSRERAQRACLHCLVYGPERIFSDLAEAGSSKEILRVVRHRPMRVLLATQRVVTDLRTAASCDYFALRLPRDIVEAAGQAITGEARPLVHLRGLLAGPARTHAMTASLLHIVDPAWVSESEPPLRLEGAYLDKVRWLGAQLKRANLARADLSQADLRGANLDQARLERADLTGADLRDASLLHADGRYATLRRALLTNAKLGEFQGNGCQLTFANLSGAAADLANFNNADLASADLEGATLRGTAFQCANVKEAILSGADLSRANFLGAKIDGTNFTNANLDGADLSRLCLRAAHFADARFPRANLAEADLEYMELPNAYFAGAHLRGALLTGTIMPNADFSGASLQEAGLAEIEWEGASLRDADLRGVSFHLGSSRSGRVYSPIACEGSRTGFYTDDYDEQTFKSPEEIRKANLCRADLRGACLDDVDFYLVDLRGALYDAKYEAHLRRCGAILEARVA